MKKYRIFIILLIIFMALFTGCKKEDSGGHGDTENTQSSGENHSSGGNEGNHSSGNSSDSFPEQIYVRHILVATRVEAEEIINKLEDGADFEEMAREYSKCPSKLKGGKLDPFGKGEKAKSFELAALSLKSGEISGPVETEYGWEIIEKLPTPVPPTPTPVPPVRIRHIIVAHEEEAKEIIEELKKGGDFTHLAMEKSLCPSRAKGGELGLIHYGEQLIPELETVAFSLEIGEISEPVKTQHGWHIMQRIDPDMKIELPELERIRIRHILVEKEEEAKEIYEELKEGGDFTRIAAEKSICTTKEKGGDLGEFTIGVMTKSLEDAALSLKPGEISEPVESPYGWHIIQRLELDYKIELLPEEIRISHILVKTEEEAEEILKELKEGKKFEDLAREKSKCPSAEKGGDFGFIKQDELVENFNDAVFILKIGETSVPVQTMEGWHIVMRTE